MNSPVSGSDRRLDQHSFFSHRQMFQRVSRRSRAVALGDPFDLPGLHFSFPCVGSGGRRILGYWEEVQEQLVKRSGEDEGGDAEGGGGESEVVIYVAEAISSIDQSLGNGSHIQGRQQARQLPNPDTGRK
jgi:hypothetical protein